jgi:hypothetical protein
MLGFPDQPFPEVESPTSIQVSIPSVHSKLFGHFRAIFKKKNR